ncbi:hypothetical protein Trydic_g1768 [Trypoxylus dichotomus]
MATGESAEIQQAVGRTENHLRLDGRGERCGLGCLGGTYPIEIDKTIKPVIHPPRKVPFALKNELKQKLESLVKQNVIEKVTKATDWVNSLVIVHKKDQIIRLCIDPTDLNKAIKRQHFQIPTLDEILSKIVVVGFGKDIVVSCYSSHFACGAVLLQDNSPIAFLSWALTPTQQRYGQIEKQMLSIVLACEKSHQYIYGRTDVTIETDRRPLVMIYNKPLIQAPARLQRMLIKLQQYSFNLVYKKSKELYIADTLSRAVTERIISQDEEEFEAQLCFVRKSLTMTDARFQEFQRVTASDSHLMQFSRYAPSNGLVERTIPTVKNTLKKSRLDGTDPYLALLMLRNTPISSEIPSPAQILYSRRLRHILPATGKMLRKTIERQET